MQVNTSFGWDAEPGPAEKTEWQQLDNSGHNTGESVGECEQWVVVGGKNGEEIRAERVLREERHQIAAAAAPPILSPFLASIHQNCWHKSEQIHWGSEGLPENKFSLILMDATFPLEKLHRFQGSYIGLGCIYAMASHTVTKLLNLISVAACHISPWETPKKGTDISKGIFTSLPPTLEGQFHLSHQKLRLSVS